MTDRPWSLAEQPPVEHNNEFPELPSVIVRLLWQRGYRTAEAIRNFLRPDYSQGLQDPFVLSQMTHAVETIIAAVKDRRQITIYGDYDVDGVTATATMVETLTALGGNVNWYLPERLAEGYGLNVSAIEDLAARGTKLLITVDCGSTNVAEIARANALGLQVIVLDHHHQPETIPDATAIINPVFEREARSFQYYSSGGVAFTVTRALLQATNNGATVGHRLPDGWEKWLMDLTALSTVADMMAMTGENRLLVKYGLLVLRKTRRPGLRSLFDVMGAELGKADETTIGFQIAPRLNAAGRLHHASIALELLLTKDAAQGRQLAEQLHAVNSERQRLTEMAVNEALEQIELQGEQSAYTAFAPHWSPGIIGLIAGRLVERVWRPVLVMTQNGDEIVGSGRSTPGYDIMSTLDVGAEHFRRFGGHPGACGFTLISLEARPTFERWFREHTQATVPPGRTQKPVMIDLVATLADMDGETIDLIDACAPYGQTNPRPVFMVTGVEVVDAQPVGATRQHVKLIGRQGEQIGKFIGFRFGERLNELTAGARIDVAVEVSWNAWNGRKERQLKIIDWRASA